MSLPVGCRPSASRELSVQVTVFNRSDTDIRFLVLDPDGVGNHFGFFSSGGGAGTAGGCRFRLAEDLVIEWEENEKLRRASVRLAQFREKRREIKSFTFIYHGKDQWEVVAQSGLSDDSPRVVP